MNAPADAKVSEERLDELIAAYEPEEQYPAGVPVIDVLRALRELSAARAALREVEPYLDFLHNAWSGKPTGKHGLTFYSLDALRAKIKGVRVQGRVGIDRLSRRPV